MQRRFGQFLIDGELTASAIVHPKFETAWVKDSEQKRIGLAYLPSQIQLNITLTNSDTTSMSKESANTDVEDDFFTFRSDRKMGLTAC